MIEQDHCDDGVLIKAYLEGSDQALEQLFERYRKRLYSYLNGLFSGDSAAADDVFQETWVRIIGALPKFKDYERFPAWAFSIAHNQAMQNFRKRKVTDKVGRLTADGNLPDLPEQRAGSCPDNALNIREIDEKLTQALNLLPEEQKEVFMLRRQNVSFREIAGIQGCPLNTALSRMRYVMLFLRKELQGIL